MRHMVSSWVVWLGLVGVVACGLTALVQGQRRPGPDPARLITGNDIGFRVDGTDPRTGDPTGIWMVRMGGEWVEVGPTTLVRPAK